MDQTSLEIEQLYRFTRPLNKHQIKYWTNDGTVLGLIRSGELLENDDDIDIGIWASNKKEFGRLLEIYKNYYEIKPHRVNGTVFSYAFHPLSGGRTVNVKLFWSDDEYAYSLAPYRMNTVSGNPLEFTWISDSIRKSIGKVYAELYKWRTGIWPIVTPIWSFREFRVWKIPADYFLTLEFNQTFDVYVPGKVESYLEYRYGDWKTPVNDWDTWEDDGGVAPIDPKDICALPFFK